MSLLRENVVHLFDCFCEVSTPSSFEERLDSSQIRLKYPKSFEKASILNEVPNFAYPCAVESTAVEHFSFVLFVDHKWLYGFCRCSPTDGAAMVLLSPLPWHDLMYKLLDTLHLMAADGGDSYLLQCLTTAYRTPVPADGDKLHFKLPDGSEFSAECPDRRRLPSLLVDRNLTEYWSVVDHSTKLEVFAALLHERHILVTSSRLSRLSACVQAAQALLYPLWWQRIFMPVVPDLHRGLLASPPAFLAGCPASVVAKLEPDDLAEGCVRLNADLSKLNNPHNDLQKLPADVVTNLRRQLKQAEAGDGVARAFQTAVLQLVGGYRHGIRRPANGPAKFDQAAFLQSQPSGRRTFLRTLVNTQMFQQFIEERLSRPEDTSVDMLVRQPSVKTRRVWLKSLVARRRMLSDDPNSRAVTAPLRGPFAGPASSSSMQRGSYGLPSAATQSAPSSPATERLILHPSAPSLLKMAGRQVTSMSIDLGDRMGGTALQDDPTSDDDPLAGFEMSGGGSSLMDEINAELQKLGQMSPLSDVSSPRFPADDAAPSAVGGSSFSDSDDVFLGGASELPRGLLGGASERPRGLPPAANGRPRSQVLTQLRHGGSGRR